MTRFLRWAGILYGGFAAPAEAPAISPYGLARARAVARRRDRLTDRLPWHSTCLVRAMAGSLLLARRRVAGARIRFGVSRENGVFAAHAWLLLGDETLLGGAEAVAHTPLADLG